MSNLRKKKGKSKNFENLRKTFKRAVGVARHVGLLHLTARESCKRFALATPPGRPRDYVPIPYLNTEARETDCPWAVTAEGASGSSGEKGKQPLDVATAAVTAQGGDSYCGRAEERRKQAGTVCLL